MRGLPWLTHGCHWLVDIKNKKFTAPTPQNTPINTAPINSQFNPSIPAITEEMETITTSGKDMKRVKKEKIRLTRL